MKHNLYPCRCCGSFIDHDYFACVVRVKQQKDEAERKETLSSKLATQLLEAIENKDKEALQGIIKYFI